MNELPLRKKTFYKLSSEIARLDGARLQSLIETSDPGSGWGRSHTADLGKSKVFVKRLPVTDVEYENLFSTRNGYELPTYYNYGVGSAGFGAFRELTAHLKTTQWVLDGESETFPLRRLLYHPLLEYRDRWRSALPADGILGLQKSCSDSIVKYRSTALLIDRFFSDLTRNPKKDTPYPNAELKRLLKQTGYL